MGALIELFYDVGSPYSYLATTQIEALATRCGATLRWRPFFLGGVFKAVGGSSLLSVAGKARWMLRDLAAWAELYDVPFAFPAAIFPPNTLLAQRVLTGAGDALVPLTHALFRAYWAAGRNVSDARVIGAIAGELGLDGEALLARAATVEVKDALRATTDEAVARGAFGAPSLFVGAELYFGNDRLTMLERDLAPGGRLAR